MYIVLKRLTSLERSMVVVVTVSFPEV